MTAPLLWASSGRLSDSERWVYMANVFVFPARDYRSLALMRETSFSVGIFLLPKMLEASQNSNEKKANMVTIHYIKNPEFCSCYSIK